jgi:hypothetical protein
MDKAHSSEHCQYPTTDGMNVSLACSITPLDTNPKPHLPKNPFHFSLKLRLRPKCYTSLDPHAFYTSKSAYIP